MVQKREFLIQTCPSIVHMGTTYHICFYLQMVVALPGQLWAEIECLYWPPRMGLIVLP